MKEKTHFDVKLNGRKIGMLRFADDITILAEIKKNVLRIWKKR